MIYFGTTELTNINNLVPQTGLDITDIWFGSTNVYTVWATYEGTLPATLNVNGDDMRQYRLYGNAGGVGDKTANLFDLSTITQGKYINAQGNESNSGALVEDSMLNHSDFIPVLENTNYFFYHTGQPISANSQNVALCWFDSQKKILSRILKSIPMMTASYSISGASPTGSAFVIVNFAGYTSANPGKNYFAPGTTPPEAFVPFGYELDMSVSDGTTSTTTPIYIGDEPLGKDEYVNYQEQKVYRMINGTLSPTDPPAPLPALPTCDGETVVDYAGSGTAPEKVLLKYRKEGY